MSENLEKHISDILYAFNENKVELALLFGSAADDNLSNTSDIDIAISTQKPLNAETKWEIIQQLGKQLGRPIDLIDLKNASPLLTAEIVNSGKRLFGTGAFISRHIMDYEDFAPLQKRILKERRERWTNQ